MKMRPPSSKLMFPKLQNCRQVQPPRVQCSYSRGPALWTGTSLYLWVLASRTSFSTRLVLVGVEDRATKRISWLSAHAVLGTIALHTAKAQQTNNWEMSGRRRRCQDLGAFMRAMKLSARAELRNILLLVRTSLSLQVICKSRCSQSLLNLGMIIRKGLDMVHHTWTSGDRSSVRT